MSTETQRVELPPLVGILAKQPDHVRQSIEAYGAACARVAKASQAAEIEALKKDAERLDWLHQKLFVSKWNGVIDSGSRTSWHIAGDYRHTTVTMNGATFREAIDAAMQTKEAS